MVKIRQAGQSQRAKRWFSLLAWGSVGLATTLNAGCSSSPVANSQNRDPLNGIMTPPDMPLPASAPKTDNASAPFTPQPNNQGVQAIQASMSSGSPATLAGTNWQGPLGRPTPLGDNNSSGPPFLPGQGTLGSKTQQVPMLGPNPNPKVEQVPDLAPPTPPVTPTASWQNPQSNQPAVQVANNVQPTEAEQLAKRLQDRGVLKQNQEATPDGLRLTVYLSRGPEGGLRVLEVTASDYPSAAQAILQQLEAGR